MGKVLVDNIEVEVADSERLNGIQAAKRAGIDVPHYCWHPGLSVVASCRNVPGRNWNARQRDRQGHHDAALVPACQTPAKDGAVFVTE